MENDVVIVAGVTNTEPDWHRGIAYVGMSRARTRLHVIINDAEQFFPGSPQPNIPNDSRKLRGRRSDNQGYAASSN